jgi:tetratricopeptide (TPR) repeat protein
MQRTAKKSAITSRRAADDRAAETARTRWLAVAPGIALFLLTVMVYIPSMTNGFIWDDSAYVIDNPTLKSEAGWGTAQNLLRIWTDFRATPQYYPMVHTTFWIEARLWGTNHAAGYHVDNILLHALAAVLLWRALTAIKVPWPWLAAALFALHPVMVESVTWVTERKNVLSIVFYLLAFHAYRRSGLLDLPEFPQARDVHPKLLDRPWYFLALLLYLLALLSKTVTCSLPAALLLLAYWKRGRIGWKQVKPLLPMFAVGLILSGITSYLESTRVGASGPDFQWTPADRVLIAGHAIYFYATKLLWPHPLIFMYPHWDLHTHRELQWIYPTAVIAVVAALWAGRKTIGRGPLVAVLFFTGTLTPALGFVNVYPMRYSFVADHFQYLASIGILVLVTAVLSKLKFKCSEGILGTVLLIPLAILTWRQQHIYKNAQTLWRNTIQQNPGCWMAHVNLSSTLQKTNQAQAIAESEEARRLAPYEADTNYDLGVARAEQQRWADARQYFEEAIRCDPKCAPAWSYLARLLWEHFDSDQDKAEAVRAAHKALTVRPDTDLADAHYVLGRAAQFYGDYAGAIVQYRKELEQNDGDFYGHFNYGFCLLQTHRPADAAAEFKKVLDHTPADTGALVYMGDAYRELGMPKEAASFYRKALSINPDLTAAKDGIKALK